MSKLTHFDESGASRMVDVSDKDVTQRIAIAHAKITMKPETLKLIHDKKVAKGDVLEVARVAGILAAKQTSTLIPMCHPLPSIVAATRISHGMTIRAATGIYTMPTGTAIAGRHSAGLIQAAG